MPSRIVSTVLSKASAIYPSATAPKAPIELAADFLPFLAGLDALLPPGPPTVLILRDAPLEEAKLERPPFPFFFLPLRALAAAFRASSSRMRRAFLPL